MRRLPLFIAFAVFVIISCKNDPVNDIAPFPITYKSWKIISPYKAEWIGNQKDSVTTTAGGDTTIFGKPGKLSMSLQVDSAEKANGELNQNRSHTGQFSIYLTDRTFSLSKWNRDSVYTYNLAIDVIMPSQKNGFASLFSRNAGWRGMHGNIRYEFDLSFIPGGNHDSPYFNAFYFVKGSGKTYKPSTLPLYQAFQFNLGDSIYKTSYTNWANTLPMYQYREFSMPGFYEVIRYLVYGGNPPKGT